MAKKFVCSQLSRATAGAVFFLLFHLLTLLQKYVIIYLRVVLLLLTAKVPRRWSGLFYALFRLVFYMIFAHHVQFSCKKRAFFYMIFAQEKTPANAYSTRFEGIFASKILFNIYKRV